MHPVDQLTPEQISQSLRRFEQQQSTADVPYYWDERRCRKAAVLIPFVRDDDQWRIVFIRRADHELDHHSGQVAFAGGKHESDDPSLRHTALREAQEEIGIDPAHVTVLGELNHHYSITHFKITPVVAQLRWPYRFNPDATEVARVFSIPLQWLADPANHRVEERRFNGRAAPVVFYEEFDGELLWGATARMTLSLITSLGL